MEAHTVDERVIDRVCCASMDLCALLETKALAEETARGTNIAKGANSKSCKATGHDQSLLCGKISSA